jgi:hypothetical protein
LKSFIEENDLEHIFQTLHAMFGYCLEQGTYFSQYSTKSFHGIAFLTFLPRPIRKLLVLVVGGITAKLCIVKGYNFNHKIVLVS